MMKEKINNFYELDAWRKAHQFVLEIYSITKSFPKEELFGVTSQLHRAACSITANIAEGFSRYHYNDKIRFYLNARGSVSEVQNFLGYRKVYRVPPRNFVRKSPESPAKRRGRSFLFLSKDLFYLLKENNFDKMIRLSEDVAKLINGLIRSIDNQK